MPPINRSAALSSVPPSPIDKEGSQASDTSKKIKEYAVVAFAVLATVFTAATIPLFVSYLIYDTALSYARDSLFAGLTCFVIGSYLETPSAQQPPAYPYSRTQQPATTRIPPITSPPLSHPQDGSPLTLIGQGPGIVNGGNTCFINAAFHALIETPFGPALEASYPDGSPVKTALQKYKDAKDRGLSFIPGTPWKWGFLSGETPFTLAPLRALLQDERNEWAMGDPDEMIGLLLQRVETRKYPNLFFNMTIERQVEELDPETIEPENLRLKITKKFGQDREIILKKLGEVDGVNQARSKNTLIPDDHTLKTTESYYRIHVPVPAEEGRTGQQLLDDLFRWQDNPQHDPIAGIEHFEKPDRQAVKLFRVSRQRTYLNGDPPAQFFLVLKRFTYANGYPEKINTKILMDDVITLGGAQYDLKKIIVHERAHYWDLIKHKDEWGLYDDANVYRAPQSKIDYAHNYGYIYYYDLKRNDAQV